jgi:rSAM/selenodomain-associated transferase 1
MTTDGRLLVFAREPIPGLVKTRLIPTLGASGAARLYQALLERAVNAAIGVPGVAVQLWCAGAPPSGGVCGELARRHGLELRHQGEGDLGQRMAEALGEALGRCDRVVLIGSDCPGYHPAYLSAAFAALGGHDAVVGPAADGGYVLIGLRRPAPDLFADIPWGTDAVLAGTRTVLARLGWTWAELPGLQDIDRPEDLAACPDLIGSQHPD